MKKTDLSPVRPSERFVILDALRGFAILGIALAKFPEFSLYTFLSAEDAAALPASGADRWIRYGLYVLVDGKFYTLFSLLFGIGFSIILHNVARKGGNAIRLFFRRMGLLALIGFLHLMGIWSGDILLLYALLGMCLSLFRKLSDRWLLGVAAALLFLRRPRLPLFRWLAAPGRMALSNYIGQSVAGMGIFYGIGLGLGAHTSLLFTEVIVLAVFLFQQVFSQRWLTFFRFSPLEWIWRMLTYGHWIDCRKPKQRMEV